MIKQVCVCNNCGKELTTPTKYHIDFATSKFCDASGDMDYNSIRVDLCEKCAEDAIKTLKALLKKQGATYLSIPEESCSCYEERCELVPMSEYERGVAMGMAIANKQDVTSIPKFKTIQQGYCRGTKEYEKCDCKGIRKNCTHYPENRK